MGELENVEVTFVNIVSGQALVSFIVTVTNITEMNQEFSTHDGALELVELIRKKTRVLLAKGHVSNGIEANWRGWRGRNSRIERTMAFL